ncbi:hypothetical protein [Streptomyces sp. NPDC059649]|uniref:hypothetical protein n=1 Tax=Streptomyces sp. NPDC059649 TaxID=3346895 RepID=UPI0036D1D4E4
MDRQLEEAQDTRTRLRWGPFARVYRENDTSAFKEHKVIQPDGSIDRIVLRPDFRQLLADLRIPHCAWAASCGGMMRGALLEERS